MTKLNKHVNALDGIRGFALILVFCYHSLGSTLTRGSVALRVAKTGWVGVDLFFVLSGFLITGILLNERDAINYYKVFYIRRSLRILPLYYLVMIGSLIIFEGSYKWKVQMFYWLNFSNIPTALYPFLIPNLAHYWSLAIEEQFYLVWPAAIRRISDRRLIALCVVTITGTFFLRNLPVIMNLNAKWPELLNRFTLFRIDTLCAGALLAILVHTKSRWQKRESLFRAMFLISGIAFCLTSFGQERNYWLNVRFGYSLLVLCFSSLIMLALRTGWTSRVFSNSFLRQTGKYSYCFYLIHPFIINHHAVLSRSRFVMSFEAKSPTLAAFTTSLIIFAVTFALCSLSWKYIEYPLLQKRMDYPYIRHEEARSKLGDGASS